MKKKHVLRIFVAWKKIMAGSRLYVDGSVANEASDSA
jgi:hypothetical protein